MKERGRNTCKHLFLFRKYLGFFYSGWFQKLTKTSVRKNPQETSIINAEERMTVLARTGIKLS
jgi:hypothetical protein